MANELTEKEQSKVKVIEGTELGEILKPLITEVHLFDSYIAGTTYLSDSSVLEKLAPEDRLTLRREENKFDSNAILVLNDEGAKLGYIPEKDNLIFARLMDAGKILCGKVKEIKIRGTFHQISIGIYLMDI